VQAAVYPPTTRDTHAAAALLDRELRRVRRFATMLHDHRSIVQLSAYERELEAQLSRTLGGVERLDTMLRSLS
jgi:hypothetical protein